jgi:hypothetical protein
MREKINANLCISQHTCQRTACKHDTHGDYIGYDVTQVLVPITSQGSCPFPIGLQRTVTVAQHDMNDVKDSLDQIRSYFKYREEFVFHSSPPHLLTGLNPKTTMAAENFILDLSK